MRASQYHFLLLRLANDFIFLLKIIPNGENYKTCLFSWAQWLRSKIRTAGIYTTDTDCANVKFQIYFQILLHPKPENNLFHNLWNIFLWLLIMKTNYISIFINLNKSIFWKTHPFWNSRNAFNSVGLQPCTVMALLEGYLKLSLKPSKRKTFFRHIVLNKNYRNYFDVTESIIDYWINCSVVLEISRKGQRPVSGSGALLLLFETFKEKSFSILGSTYRLQIIANLPR